MRYLYRKMHYAMLASAVDAAGGLWKRTQRVRPFPAHPKKTLLVRLDQLGDILNATALPQVIKENFAGTELHFLTNAAGEALLANNPFVDRIWVYEPEWSSRRRGQKGMSDADVVRALRREKIDLAFSLRGDAREHLLLRRARVGCLVGYGVTGGGFLLDREAVYAHDVHESRHTLDLLAYAGVTARGDLAPKLYFSEEEERRFAEDLARWGVPRGRWTGVQADAGTEAKEWPLENLDRFIGLCEAEWPEAPVVFLGSSPDRAEWLAKRLAERPAANRVSLVGQTSLRQLFYLIRSLRCFVGPDSGPAHVAAAFGRPTLVLASGTNVYEEWKPLSESAEFLRRHVSCSPCHLVRCPVEGHPCMSGIQPEQVLGWLKERVHG